ncbi:Terpene synthase [Actinidia chinensis var. chinensis]|uniref:Terpene synthase n=1 Tax=Actinidia chinensis var. chinensis TaxID=1590841 RepID=A0A2R6QWA6_ACTCC|nr:Terpene synthase [Actinidia chinensis var. chinensis]WDY79043.1 nerolidol synthase 2 [Actinidia chinensis]
MSKTNESTGNQRRSANYHPSVWDPKFIEALSTSYTYELYGTKLDNLKQEARKLLNSTRDPLKFIDSMQRLGVAYHFEEEIKEILNLVRCDEGLDLYTTALQFRLLREHGYPISSDVFSKFKDGEEGRFMEKLSEDIMGLLSLYEASYYGMHGEDDLEEAKDFSVKHLKSLIGNMDIKLAEQVQESLEFPLRWRMLRLEARSFIHLYEMDDAKSSLLLELAKLDYNLVQSVHQKEVKELTKWWMDLGLKEKLSFSRDRLIENYLWAMGIISEPRFSNYRKGITKFVCILSTIDDMYDIYGSLDELEHFTDAVNRWDIHAIDELPDYMKTCYLAMFNFGNEIVYNVLRDHDVNVVSHIHEAWGNLCTSYLVEARWFYSGYTPTLDEYLQNAWISVGGPGGMAHAYLLLGSPITKTSLASIQASSEPVYWSSLIARLCDDLGTFKAEISRGDVAKSVQCYMIKEDVTEEKALDHIKGLISFAWRKLNEASARNSFPKSIITISLNMARVAQCIYQHGDGIGTSTGVIKKRLISLIVDPIPIVRRSHEEE